MEELNRIKNARWTAPDFGIWCGVKLTETSKGGLLDLVLTRVELMLSHKRKRTNQTKSFWAVWSRSGDLWHYFNLRSGSIITRLCTSVGVFQSTNPHLTSCFCSQHHAFHGVKKKIQGESSSLWCHGCNRTVFSWTPGHAGPHQEPPVKVSLLTQKPLNYDHCDVTVMLSAGCQGGSDCWQRDTNCRQGPSESSQRGPSWGPQHDGEAGESGEAGNQ